MPSFGGLIFASYFIFSAGEAVRVRDKKRAIKPIKQRYTNFFRRDVTPSWKEYFLLELLCEYFYLPVITAKTKGGRPG
jgi:hypothetical protein